MGVAWLTADIQDVFEVLVLTLIEQILLGNPASPLRKALLESSLGSALADATGFDADSRDTLFFCGLKDVAEKDADRIVTLITETLEQLCEEGVDPELIESAIHQVEFHRKEITNTPYPYGIKLMLMVIGSWLHGGDPERILQLDADFERLHREIDAGDFLEVQQHWAQNLVVGFARGIVYLMGGDDPTVPSLLNTFLHFGSTSLNGLPVWLAAWMMYLGQSVFNFLVTSGSGQAALTMPIMAPLSDLVGVTRQVAVLAFQLGDGLTNIVVPTSAALMGSLGAARVEWLHWVRGIGALFAGLVLLSSGFVIGAALGGFS